MLCFIKQKPEVVPQATTALRKSLSIERLVIKSWALWAPGGAEQPLLVSLPNTIIAFHLPSLPLALATVWPHTKLFSPIEQTLQQQQTTLRSRAPSRSIALPLPEYVSKWASYCPKPLSGQFIFSPCIKEDLAWLCISIWVSKLAVFAWNRDGIYYLYWRVIYGLGHVLGAVGMENKNALFKSFAKKPTYGLDVSWIWYLIFFSCICHR